MFSDHLRQSHSASAFLIFASVFTLIAAFPPTAKALDTALPAALCASVFAAPEFSIENVTVLHTLAPDRIPLWPVWSQDGKRIAFTATDPDLMQGYSWLSEIWVMDVATFPAAKRLLRESNGATCGSLNFTPNDAALLYIDHITGEYGGMPSLCDAHVAGTETSLGIRATDLDHSIVSGTIFHTDIRETPHGNRMVVDLEKYGVHTTVSVYLIPTTASGVPQVSSATEIVNDVLGISPVRLSLSPSGNELLFAHSSTGPKPNVALITGLDRIVSGEDPPISSWGDSRVKIMNDGPNHADAPSWSEDGSLFFYGYDFIGAFNMIDMNFEVANFDVMVVRLEDALAGNLNPTRLQIPGNQGCIYASRGGTRIVFGQTGSPDYQICAATLRISDLMLIDGAGVVQTPFTLKDGSGTTLSVDQSTVVSGYGTGSGPLRLSVFTPISPLEEAALMTGTVGIGALRVWSYQNLASGGNPNPQPASFDPPATVEFSYTDAEIRGLDEEELLVYEYDPETGFFDRLLPVIKHDPDANRITVQLESIAPAVTGGGKSGKAQAVGSLALGIVDSDRDGLSDGMELRWDGDPAANIYDADTNPTGTDLNPWKADTDGDGIRDSDEIAFGFNPIDPASAPEFPATGSGALASLVTMLALAGLRAQCKGRRAL